jgi:hypothetical protein
MKLVNAVFVTLILGVQSSVVQATPGEDYSIPDKAWPMMDTYYANASFYDDLGISQETIISLQSHPAVQSNFLHRYVAKSANRLGNVSNATVSDPASDYETYIPHKTQPKISRFEKLILAAYLKKTNDVSLAQFLAVYHLNQSLLRRKDGKAVGHTIIAQYFLNRSLDLGGDRRWVRKALAETDKELNELIARGHANDNAAENADENHAAHKYFRTAFFGNHEENRYISVEKLMDDFASHPNNMLTNTYLTTANIWVGGEAGYDDPTILYSFVLSSYFSVRARTLAEGVEELWREDPVYNKRFRLATLIGGWTVPARRWLAKLHEDHQAVKLLDAEHRKWLEINTAFTSVPVGLMLFDEKENFDEGFAAWEAGRRHCEEAPPNLSCINWPRSSFNILSFVLGEVDFFLKAGQLEQAKTLLSWRFIPIDIFADSFAVWDLGRDAWEHRENNLESIAELYQNDNPNDDPTHFLLKQHKWGPNTITCQVCHQRQSKVWPEGEVDRVFSIADEFPPIGSGNWPEVSTTWYGSVKRN